MKHDWNVVVPEDTVFGKVIENVDLVDAIAQGDAIIGITVTE